MGVWREAFWQNIFSLVYPMFLFSNLKSRKPKLRTTDTSASKYCPSVMLVSILRQTTYSVFQKGFVWPVLIGNRFNRSKHVNHYLWEEKKKRKHFLLTSKKRNCFQSLLNCPDTMTTVEDSDPFGVTVWKESLFPGQFGTIEVKLETCAAQILNISYADNCGKKQYKKIKINSVAVNIR